MTRTGEPDVAELMAQLAANAAEIAALKVEKEALSQRVVKLEEELALARLHRFAPRSEKHIDRLFNEAEEAADESDRDYGDDVADLPDTGLPAVEGVSGILCWGPVSSVEEPFAKDDGELCLCLDPFPRRALPLFSRVVENQI